MFSKLIVTFMELSGIRSPLPRRIPYNTPLRQLRQLRNQATKRYKRKMSYVSHVSPIILYSDDTDTNYCDEIEIMALTPLPFYTYCSCELIHSDRVDVPFSPISVVLVPVCSKRCACTFQSLLQPNVFDDKYQTYDLQPKIPCFKRNISLLLVVLEQYNIAKQTPLRFGVLFSRF